MLAWLSLLHVLLQIQVSCCTYCTVHPKRSKKTTGMISLLFYLVIDVSIVCHVSFFHSRSSNMHDVFSFLEGWCQPKSLSFSRNWKRERNPATFFNTNFRAICLELRECWRLHYLIPSRQPEILMRCFYGSDKLVTWYTSLLFMYGLLVWPKSQSPMRSAVYQTHTILSLRLVGFISLLSPGKRLPSWLFIFFPRLLPVVGHKYGILYDIRLLKISTFQQ